MRVLLDNNVNQRIRRLIAGHEVAHVREKGWSELRNGELIFAAEQSGFEALITADKQMRYQQNLKSRAISILVLNSTLLTWQRIAPLAPQIQKILDAGVEPGSIIIIDP